MLWVPQKGLTRYQSNLSSTSSATLGTSCTTGAAEATKGSIVEAIASTNFDSYMMHITIGDYTTTSTPARGCLDIMIGAGGSEQVLIENLLMGYCGGQADVQQKGPKQWMFPIYVPAGSRLSIRAAGERTSTAVRCAITLMGGTVSPMFQVGTKVTTYGVGTVANGTTITEGGSGAEGSWAQITSSTSVEHFCLVPSYQFNTTTASTERYSYVDIGIGAASSEVQLGTPYVYSTGFYAPMDGPFNPMPVFCNVPAATRLAMRASNSGTARAAQGAIHGVS
jgi:hypothetical protein